jgi:hypothetical protein
MYIGNLMLFVFSVPLWCLTCIFFFFNKLLCFFLLIRRVAWWSSYCLRSRNIGPWTHVCAWEYCTESGVILSPWVEIDILSCAFAILSVLALWPLILILHLSIDLKDSTHEAMTNVALSYHHKNFAIQQAHITTMTQITIRSKSHEGTPKQSCHTVYPQMDRPNYDTWHCCIWLIKDAYLDQKNNGRNNKRPIPASTNGDQFNRILLHPKKKTLEIG